MQQKLTEMIDALVTEKTFSLAGVQAIEALRAKADGLEKMVESVTKERDSYSTQRDLANKAANEKTAVIEGWMKRETDIVTREKTMTAKDQEAAVSKARADTFAECFGMVFRNIEVRREMFGTAPNPPSANPNYYPSGPNTPVNETVTTKTG